MKPKDFAKDVFVRMTEEEYQPRGLSTLIHFLYPGIEVKDDTVYARIEDGCTDPFKGFKEEYLPPDVEDSKVVEYFNKASKYFRELVDEFLKDDNVEMDLAMSMVVYLRDYDIEYTGKYKVAREIIDKFDIFDNCDSAMIELTNLAYQYDAIAKQYREIDPKRFLDDIADFVVKYFKGYYDE